MAIEKKNKDTKQVQEPKDHEIRVLKVRDMKDRKDCYRFSMIVNDVTIYGCQYITYTDRDGNEKCFISMPQYKGNDDKYYNHCYVKLSDFDVGVIEKQIGEMV